MRRQMSSSSTAMADLFPNLPTLDPERVAMLHELCVDAGPGVLQEIVESWQTEASRHLAGAEQAMQAADVPQTKAAAHALKGSCGNMGVARLAELGRQLELKAHLPEEAPLVLAEMRAEFDRARQQLAQLS